MVYVINGRQLGKGAKIGIYTPDFQKLDVRRDDEFIADETIHKPQNYTQMLSIAQQLSSNFPHVRVDLYNVNGKIYFGEMTFYDGSGYMTFNPDSFDEKMGDLFEINSLI